MRGGKKPSILVIEKDTSYKHSATALCAASFRTQFSTAENIQMSLFGGHFLKNIEKYLSVDGQDAPNIQLHEHGYLFLGSKENKVGVQHMRENFSTQTKEGAKIALLSQKELAEKFPWLKTDDIELVICLFPSFGSVCFSLSLPPPVPPRLPRPSHVPPRLPLVHYTNTYSKLCRRRSLTISGLAGLAGGGLARCIQCPAGISQQGPKPGCRLHA